MSIDKKFDTFAETQTKGPRLRGATRAVMMAVPPPGHTSPIEATVLEGTPDQAFAALRHKCFNRGAVEIVKSIVHMSSTPNSLANFAVIMESDARIQLSFMKAAA
jgi:hypothetical protein